MTSMPKSDDPCRAGSVPYKEIGAAWRLIFQRAAQGKLNGTDWRVLGAVTSLTATYSKLYDKTSVAQIASLADLDRTDSNLSRTKKALKKLAGLDLIEYQPARKHGEHTLVGLAIGLTAKDSA
jgi:hypothetical protein